MKIYENLPIFHIHTGNLDPYTTTKADIKAGRNKTPKRNHQIEEENIYAEEACAAMRAYRVA